MAQGPTEPKEIVIPVLLVKRMWAETSQLIFPWAETSCQKIARTLGSHFCRNSSFLAIGVKNWTFSAQWSVTVLKNQPRCDRGLRILGMLKRKSIRRSQPTSLSQVKPILMGSSGSHGPWAAILHKTLYTLATFGPNQRHAGSEECLFNRKIN